MTMPEISPTNASEVLAQLRTEIRQVTLPDEQTYMADLVARIGLKGSLREKVAAQTVSFVRDVRGSAKPTMMEAFLAEYGLSTQEGVALMTLAEALLRVPDAFTIDDLINDKISGGAWTDHLGRSDATLVNTASWALSLTSSVIDREARGQALGGVRTLVRRLGEPVVRRAVGVAMKQLGAQFVLGRTIDEALKNGRAEAASGYKFSFDMLGEAARTDADAQAYFDAYSAAIDALQPYCTSDDIRDNPGVSVKLSALHARYEFTQKQRVMAEMLPRARALALAAKQARMGFNIDAEEADRLDISLDIIEALLSDPALAGWDGFGVVVQAYGPRAEAVIKWLSALAKGLGRKIMIRLVKGAYWDSEIKRAQTMGLAGFPVFTHKRFTDLNYIACAQLLLACRDHIFPQFATHNAHTMASVLQLADAEGADVDSFEFQRLHGMGEALHDVVKRQYDSRCRIYAPVGAHKELLAYLVRRLLENGANSSFVNQIVDHSISPEDIARGPFDMFEDASLLAPNAAIVRAENIYGDVRANSIGFDWTDVDTIARLNADMAAFTTHVYKVAPLTSATGSLEAAVNSYSPAVRTDLVGQVQNAGAELAEAAVTAAHAAAGRWDAMGFEVRADILEAIAKSYEHHAAELMLLVQRECGKSLMDAIAELREAVDFLYYYAAEARKLGPHAGPRGVFVCISPWNFPLAIFTGQIAAALVTGNAVVAKPAEQSPIIAWRAVQLMLAAGVPDDVLHLLPGDGAAVGGPLTSDPRIAGVCFTGGTDTAQIINRSMAATGNADARLIAETGGLNAMLVDSSALPEQVVRDVVASSFQSAGQRCSALRMLYVQEDIADGVIEMLTGAMDEMAVGDPLDLATDVGPVIDAEARDAILAYCSQMEADGKLVHKLSFPDDDSLAAGYFVPPHLFRVDGIDSLAREIFGPILHVATFKAKDLDSVMSRINGRGYGLTMGIHSRIEGRIDRLVASAHVGNIYVNRNQIGAIVASQPFGGEGLSGTGPKAGGPNYLHGFLATPAAETTPHVAPPSLPQADVAKLNQVLAAHTALWDPHLTTDEAGAAHKLLSAAAPDSYSAAAPHVGAQLDMQGPTGETNQLRLMPRGRFLAFGDDVDGVKRSVITALTLGNAVVMCGAGAADFMAPFAAVGLPAVGVDAAISPDQFSDVSDDLTGVIFCPSADQQADKLPLRRTLAARDGKIVAILDAASSVHEYLTERHVCIDTTAAGGNASLLASSSDD